MSKEYIAFAVMILGFILPKLGVDVDASTLTSTIHTLIVVVAGIAGMVARYQKGDISLLGQKV